MDGQVPDVKQIIKERYFGYILNLFLTKLQSNVIQCVICATAQRLLKDSFLADPFHSHNTPLPHNFDQFKIGLYQYRISELG